MDSPGLGLLSPWRQAAAPEAQKRSSLPQLPLCPAGTHLSLGHGLQSLRGSQICLRLPDALCALHPLQLAWAHCGQTTLVSVHRTLPQLCNPGSLPATWHQAGRSCTCWAPNGVKSSRCSPGSPEVEGRERIEEHEAENGSSVGLASRCYFKCPFSSSSSPLTSKAHPPVQRDFLVLISHG